MNKILSYERCGGRWRVLVETPSGDRMVLPCDGSEPQALEQARWWDGIVELA